MPRRELVPAAFWRRIQPLFPLHPPRPKGGRPPVDDRACLRGIIFVLRKKGCLDFSRDSADSSSVRALKKGLQRVPTRRTERRRVASTIFSSLEKSRAPDGAADWGARPGWCYQKRRDQRCPKLASRSAEVICRQMKRPPSMQWLFFLKDYWNREGRPDALGDLLSGLQVGEDTVSPWIRLIGLIGCEP